MKKIIVYTALVLGILIALYLLIYGKHNNFDINYSLSFFAALLIFLPLTSLYVDQKDQKMRERLTGPDKEFWKAFYGIKDYY